jgi:predicted deacylase
MKGTKEGRFVSRTTREGREVRIPVGTIYGAQSGPQITIYGGQHGTEYDGIEAVQRLYRETSPADVRGTIVIALATNEESLWGWQQFAPTTPEIVAMMKELAQGSQFLINCHGGEFSEGMHPYVICRLLGRDDMDEMAMRMANAFNVPYISLSKYRGEPPPNPSGVHPAWWLWPRKSMADELQIPEITPEVGERGSRDDHGIMYGGIVNVLRTLDILAGKPVPRREPARVIGERHWITAAEAGMFFPQVDVGQDVVHGQRLGLVRDYFGATLHDVVSPADARVMNMNWGMPVQKDAFLLWLAEFEQ